MTFSELLLLTFYLFLAGLFVHKARNPKSMSWLTLGLTTVLGGWCALLLWNYSCISSSIKAQQTAIELLRNNKFFETDPALRKLIQDKVSSHPDELSRMLMDHYRVFTGYGWMVSLSYFGILSGAYGVFKLLNRKKDLAEIPTTKSV
jgi:hypothetical protein